ncbi:MAG TPA: CADD family putative folate metabolism protein [Sphingomicrobium sp.]|nr:CADD family putative folate metabolism protein [Sphingomicrobium sp.]
MFPPSLSRMIDNHVSERAMIQHPFYRAWTEGRLELATLRSYAAQYFHHVEVFPQVVSAVHSMCPDADGRRMLAENLAEEEGLGKGRDEHASMWLMFARGLGKSEDEVRRTTPTKETRELVATFRDLSHRSYAAGLAALYAYECQLPAVASAKIDGLVKRYGITDEKTLRFFKVHETADIEHSSTCRALLDRLPEHECEEALNAAKELASALWNFLSGVEAAADLSTRANA